MVKKELVFEKKMKHDPFFSELVFFSFFVAVFMTLSLLAPKEITIFVIGFFIVVCLTSFMALLATNYVTYVVKK